ncbi:CRISPR-associated protein Csx20 [Syntrophobacter fumaroxidans]|uniref:Uncharacterized protein n=1 Tax=Syntrophobacter fumaroxidans (strain DSM 10017 / MPOB) TaxID=335543 RepID=A0LHZ0_SYNFM|nr:CRISPR-associated protein Csx20 [Syntrophobacter fumaroxidans]ABK17042.1 conserved hypothetical protein [Syntrophobacter fumaroxidans MPOB]
MPHSLIVLFNHRLTPEQELDARRNLGVSTVVQPPAAISERWANVPPDLPEIDGYLAPVKHWLETNASPGDQVLIQGDFGATYIMVNFIRGRGLTAVYSTSRREAAEEVQPDGSIKLTHVFRHQRFRKYGG